MSRRTLVLGFLVAGAALLEAAAVTSVWQGELSWLAVGGALHVGAALCTRVAARRRRVDLSVVESDLVLWTALLVPLFGPALGWWLPRAPEEQEAENAHEVFEQYAEHVKPADPDYERTLFTGDYVKDLARELDAESYKEVLRHGSTDQKRNALKRLAELGEPRHFDLIRSCLLDPSHEVRLYAYSELERAGRPFEEGIAKRARDLKRKPDDPEALIALARVYFRYAASGILDGQMGAFYFRAAERYAADARRHGLEDPGAVFVRAASLGRLDEFEQAEACLAELPEAEQDLPECCRIRAELAYRRRDFATARVEGERMRAAGGELPGWLAALTPGERR